MSTIKNREGLTILEVLITLGIFSGVIFVIASFVTGTSRFEDLVTQKLEVRQDLEQTFQSVVTEIRSMGPSALGAYPIVSAETSSLVFYSDIDLDGLSERVRYTLSTSTLLRGLIKPTGTPASYPASSEVMTIAVEKVVTSTVPIFEYYGATHTGSEPALAFPIAIVDIRVIKVTVSADLSPKAPEPIIFSDTINIRNLRSN